MSTTHRILSACLLVCGCASGPLREAPPAWDVVPLVSGVDVGMRGLSVVDARIVWAGGARGTVLRSTDGGATWQRRPIPDADSLDFRDVAAFDSLNVFVLSAGEDGRIYRTSDGGSSWQLQFRNTRAGAFFDCFDFWDRQHGIAMSDPVAGTFVIVRTGDGASWSEVPAAGLPPALAGEAAFAASGTCLVTAGPGRVYLGTGGSAQARVLVSGDGGISWQAAFAPVPAGTASAGIFSLAFRDAAYGIAAGGDYQNPGAAGTVARTTDGGRTWSAAGRTSYVSGVAYTGVGDAFVAVGTSGTRISTDGGATWLTADTVEYNAVQFAAGTTGYAVGPRGRIARIVRR